jgi:hypothetical protein
VLRSDTTDVAVRAHFSDKAISCRIKDHEHATIEPVGSFMAGENSMLEISATPFAGYTIEGWVVEKGKVRVRGTDYATVKCKEPFVIRPVVVNRMYNLTCTATEMGAVIPHATRRVVHGRPSEIIAVPDANKHFVRWRLVSGWGMIEDMQRETTTVQLLSGDAVVSAQFAATLCTLSVAATKGGYTEPGGVIRNFEGGSVTLQAIPNPKAAFVQWEIIEGEENIEFSDTITVDEQTVTSVRDHASIRAVFSTETVEMTTLSNGLGTTVPDRKKYVVKDRWVPITALPNKGQQFLQWTAVSGPMIRFKDKMSAETEVMLGGEDGIIKALFISDSTAVQSIVSTPSPQQQPETFTLLFDYDAARGSIDKENMIEVQAGVPVVVTATPHEGYYFKQWNIGSGTAMLSSYVNQTTTVTLSSGDAVVTPVFEPKQIHSLEVIFLNDSDRRKTIATEYW